MQLNQFTLHVCFKYTLILMDGKDGKKYLRDRFVVLLIWIIFDNHSVLSLLRAWIPLCNLLQMHALFAELKISPFVRFLMIIIFWPCPVLLSDLDRHSCVAVYFHSLALPYVFHLSRFRSKVQECFDKVMMINERPRSNVVL